MHMASSDKRVPELPGFYYHEEKRRYFRRPPTHFAHLPQYQRLRHPATDESADSTAQDRPHPLAMPRRSTTLLLQQANSVFGFVQFRQYRPLTGIQGLYERLMVSAERKKVFDPLHSHSHYGYYDIAISDSGELLAVMYHGMMSKYVEVFHVKDSCEIAGPTPVLTAKLADAKFDDVNLLFRFYQQENKEIFPTVHGKNIECFEFSKLTPPLTDEFEDFEWTVSSRYRYDYRSRPISALALGPSSQTCCQVAIGTDEGDIELYERQPNGQRYVSSIWRSGPSSVLSLAFSSQNPVLFSGCRNGCITGWDLRADSEFSIASVTEQGHARIHSSVIGLHPLKDDSYLISSAYNSHLSVWDLRMRRVVWSFANHVNTIKNCRSILDSSESLLFAAGSDYDIRLWSLQTGALLRAITVEEYAAPETRVEDPPPLCYTTALGGTGGPALLIATGRNQIAVFQPF